MRIPYRVGHYYRRYKWMYDEMFTRDYSFIHIPKTGGYSIENALGIDLRHITAREWIKIFGQKRWDKRFTFTIVRNPWDRMVSTYIYLQHMKQRGLGSTNDPDFNAWLKAVLVEKDLQYGSYIQYSTLTNWICDDKDNILVDFVGRFENFSRDFKIITQKLAVSPELPHLKKNIRKNYKAYYNNESIEIVKEVYAKDISLFNYSY